MKPTTIMNAVKLMALSLTLVVMAGCATGGMSSKQTAEQRAAEYWKSVLAGNFADAYQYLSPGYRSSVSSNSFQRSMLMKKVKWNEASDFESDCLESSCKVSISIKYTAYGALPGVNSFSSTQKIDENWVLVDRIWYLVPKL